MLSNQTAFISIIALVAIWLVCKFCENLALRVWGFIAIILGLIFVLGGGFSADGFAFAWHDFACCYLACVGCGFGYFAFWL